MQKENYSINRGIGRTVEFKGLKAQYLFLFAGGLLGVMILTMIMYVIGVNIYLTVGLGAILASIIVWQTFSLNRKYGEHGLMKLTANKTHPHYIVHRKAIYRFVRHTLKNNNDEKYS